MDEINMILDMMKEGMDGSIEHLQYELSKISTGKASPQMISGLAVEYYGSPTPVSQVANVSTSDSRTIIIQPWEKNMLAPIERSIFEANLGFTPQNDGEIIRINVPMLTEERRKEFVKRAKALGEDAKVSVRSARRDAMESVKMQVKDGFPEDAGKRKEQEIQDLTNGFGSKIDTLVSAKEKVIMTV